MRARLKNIDGKKTSMFRPCSLAKTKKILYHHYIYDVKNVKTGDKRFENISVNTMKDIIDVFYKKVNAKIIEGTDYHLPLIGSVSARWVKKKGAVKIKSYYKEIHTEFLDKKIVCMLLKQHPFQIKYLDRYSFVATDALKIPLMRKIINNGYGSQYLYFKK
jgi:hypothetical protein